MKAEELTRLGGFLPPQPVKRSVTWTPTHEGAEPVTFDVFVLPRTAGAMMRGRAVSKEDPENAEREAHAVYIVTFLRLGENGDETLTYEQVMRLEPSLFEAFLGAMVEAHGKPKEAPKN